MSPLKPDRPEIHRRDLVVGGAALAVGAGVASTDAIVDYLDRPTFEQVSLTIKTVPADTDSWAIGIANHLAENLRTAGLDATVVIKSTEELRRDVLYREDFDIYVDRLPLDRDPDTLRPLLHSVFLDQNGWYNPFGFADLAVDELLDEQRHADAGRAGIVSELLREITTQQPFVPVVRPSDIAAGRTDRFTGWTAASVGDPRRYLRMSYRDGARADELGLAVIDERITRNLNPLAVRFRERGTVTGLVYEPLGRWGDEALQPRLASHWEWVTGERTTCRVTLRPDLQWHDGEAITAEDVAFTYRFVSDTSLGTANVALPAPHLYGRSSLVTGIRVEDEDRVTMEFGRTGRDVARRALTVPILPAHVWEPMANLVDVASLDPEQPVTEALVFDNATPVGSGPLAVRDREPEEHLLLERVPDHFVERDDGPAEPLEFDRLRLQVAPSARTAVRLAIDGAVDGTLTLADATVVSRIGTSDELSLFVDPADLLYHVGFNARREPLANPNFRRAIARLLDKDAVATETLSGYGSPVASAFPIDDWTPTALTWQGEDPEVPFVGAGGVPDTGEARSMFRNIGYSYDAGRLVRQ